MKRLTFEVHDGGMFVKEYDVKTFDIEDEVMHTGNAIRKLAEYEDLEEQGKLLRLSCAVGDTVYEVQKPRKRIQPYEIISIKIDRMGEPYYYWKLKDGYGFYGNLKGFEGSRLGVDVFLIEEQAEAALYGAQQ